MKDRKPGQVYVSPKVAFGTVGDDFVLMHVPTDRMLVLYEHGRAIWEALSKSGSIEELVKIHAGRVGVPIEVAAFQVITFLNELRSMSIIDYTLEKEREAAPLLDTSLSAGDLKGGDLFAQLVRTREGAALPVHEEPILFENVSAETTLAALFSRYAQRAVDGGGTGESEETKLDPAEQRSAQFLQDRPDTSVGELAALRGKAHGKRMRLIVIDGDAPAIPIKKLEDASGDEVRVIAPEIVKVIDDPESTTTIGSLPKPSVGAARRVIIIVISGRDWIIIIVIGSPTGGPSWGKSQSACKTVCV